MPFPVLSIGNNVFSIENENELVFFRTDVFAHTLDTQQTLNARRAIRSNKQNFRVREIICSMLKHETRNRLVETFT